MGSRRQRPTLCRTHRADKAGVDFRRKWLFLYLMNTAQYNHLFSFIWNIANDVPVHAFEKGEYKKIIMPMAVLRRLDILLEPTKEAVLERKRALDAANISNQEPVLFQVTGYPFCNTSRFTMKKLKAEVDPKRLKMNFIEYLNGYSKDVQDIIDKFRLRQQTANKLPTYGTSKRAQTDFLMKYWKDNADIS